MSKQCHKLGVKLKLYFFQGRNCTNKEEIVQTPDAYQLVVGHNWVPNLGMRKED